MRFTDITVDEAALASVLHGTGVQRDLHRRADRVVQAAKQTAPVDTGRYRDSIHTEDGPDASLLVVASAPYALYIEHGTRVRNHPARFVLTNALDAAGGAA